jgi:hypothetical protein
LITIWILPCFGAFGHFLVFLFCTELTSCVPGSRNFSRMLGGNAKGGKQSFVAAVPYRCNAAEAVV